MSRPIVRRLTAAIALVAILCVAAPVAAAPASRAHSPAISGPSLLHQLLAWLGSLWLGHEAQVQVPAEKSAAPSGTRGGSGSSLLQGPEADGGGIFDPNG